MNNKEIYESRKKSALEAVKLIKSGDRVALGHAVGIPVELVDVMVEHKDDYENVEIIQLVPMGNANFTKPEMAGHFRLNAIFLGALTKGAVKEGRGDFTPCYFHKVPSLFDQELPLDAAMIQVTHPDSHGYVSLGVSIDYTKAAAQKAKVVIAQVNEMMPRTLGDSMLHVSEIDCFVEINHPIIELSQTHIGEVEKAIGKNCASLIHDGDCLQLGIGAIPDAVLLSLKDKKDLGIHSEMISDGVVDLVAAGVITNRKKNLNPGKSVVTFLMGTKRLYDYVNDNSSVAMMPVDYVNDPLIIGQNDNLAAINSCVQVDLMGQVCAESIGEAQISGVGGQVDFVRGASLSKGGRAIIAMPSTAAKGSVSRIVPRLDDGAVVTTSRTDVEYIVTEYGIADLKGKSLKERAIALIRIAHPSFKEELIEYFEKKFLCAYEELSA